MTSLLACTLCHTDLATEVRAAILQAGFGQQLFEVGASIAGLVALLALLARPRRRD
jgi:hypothetical protein